MHYTNDSLGQDCRPNTEGGLGIKKLEDVIVASLAKQF